MGGLYAETYTPANTFGFSDTDRLFVVGNGQAPTARSNAITVLKNGNMGLGGVTTPAHPLVVGNGATNGNGARLTAGGTWTNASSIQFKTGFTALSGAWLLKQIEGLSIRKWRYKNTEEQHIGPTAEAFIEAFDVGAPGEDSHLSTLDVAGVALRGVQALNKKLEAENQALKAQLEALLKRVEALEHKE